MAYGKCFLSGRFGPVERHHIFGGALRSKSERYGLVVELSPEMHREGPDAAHRSGETAEKLKRYGQRKVMLDQGWTVEKFRQEFGKNWLDDDELLEIRIMQRLERENPADADPAEADEWVLDPAPAGDKLCPAGVGFRVTVEFMPF